MVPYFGTISCVARTLAGFTPTSSPFHDPATWLEANKNHILTVQKDFDVAFLDGQGHPFVNFSSANLIFPVSKI